jgi:hypothetical protein
MWEWSIGRHTSSFRPSVKRLAWRKEVDMTELALIMLLLLLILRVT